jgi:diguanylate cyclase (GGDEF)-like protein
MQAAGVVDVAAEMLARPDVDQWHDVLVDVGDGVRVVPAALLLRSMGEAFAVGATHDDLTGLPNRAKFLARLKHACALLGSVEGGGLAVLFVDLDGFKRVNDTAGHHAGDLALVSTARALSAAARTGDVVARIGGDEFAVLLDFSEADCAASFHRLAGTVATIAERYRAALDNADIGVCASVGAAIASRRTDPSLLLSEADAAMYAAKGAGGNCVVVADGASTVAFAEDRSGRTRHFKVDRCGRLEQLSDQVEIEALHQALERDQLVLHYQPIVRVGDLAVVSVEALVRWQHPDRGLLGPADFLPVAEAHGLMARLDEWVLDRALFDYQRMVRDDQASAPPRINVNLSLASLARADLAATVVAALQHHRVAPSRLRLELNEEAQAELIALAAPQLAEIRQVGVSLTWDDMGAGSSSLRHITQVAVDELKIDRTFVRDMHSVPSAMAVVRMLIHLAEGLNVAVTAEGVETSAQLDTLTDLGVGYVQGYYIGMPSPLAL